MLKIKKYHPWDVSPSEAVAIQKTLRDKIVQQPLGKIPKYIAGADISYSKDSDHHIAAVVLLKFPELKVVEQASAVGIVEFPYMPGLLSFREVPLLAEAFTKLKTEPDLIFCDGQGIAHPRRMGLACHLGLILDVPTVGVAKSLLFGDFVMPDWHRGSTSPITNRGEYLGAVVRTKNQVSPLYISVGHKIALNEAVTYILKCTLKYRIPEPTRLAHNYANKLRLQAIKLPSKNITMHLPI